MSDLTVYGAPWCPDCRRSKQFLDSQGIDFDWVDIDEDESAAKKVRDMNDGKQIIPTIVFKDGSLLTEPSNDELAHKLGIERSAEKDFYDLIIIGGGPTGLTAAIYAARENIDVLVIEKSALGGQAGVTEKIDNYPGFPEGIRGEELAEKLVKHAERYEVETLTAVAVKSVKGGEEDVVVETEPGDTYRARVAIIATGTSYRKLGAEGEDDLIGAGIHYCATCDGAFYDGSDHLVVIGGGNSGLEEGLFLTQFTDKITVIEYAEELGASRNLREKVENHEKFEILTNHEVVGFDSEDGKLSTVRVKDRDSGDEKALHPAAAFVFIGLDPNTAFIKGSVDLDDGGFIETSDTLETSQPGVYAAGDVRAGSTKQLASAVGEGAAVLLMVRKRIEKLKEHAGP